MKRGDVVVTVFPGEFGKPRPGLIVQTDLLNPTHRTVLMAIITTDISGAPYRLSLAPSEATGLRQQSEVRLDQVFAVPVRKVGQIAGAIDRATQELIDELLALVLGLHAR